MGSIPTPATRKIIIKRINKVKKSQRQIVYEKAEEYAKKNLTKIRVQMGDYDGSQRCQHVARHRLETKECSRLAIVLSFVPNSGVNVHMINFNKKYIDHTLGYLSKKNVYYLIKEYELKDLIDVKMSKLLIQYKEEMLNNLFTKKEKVDLGIALNHI